MPFSSRTRRSRTCCRHCHGRTLIDACLRIHLWFRIGLKFLDDFQILIVELRQLAVKRCQDTSVLRFCDRYNCHVAAIRAETYLLCSPSLIWLHNCTRVAMRFKSSFDFLKGGEAA